MSEPTVAELQEKLKVLETEKAELETRLSGNEDLEGLKKNRDDLKAEKQKLQEKLDKITKEQESEKKKKLEADGKLKELLDVEKTEKEKAQGEVKTMKRLRNLEKVARSKGFDLDYIEAITGNVEYDENDNVVDADKFFDDLKEKKPKLFEDFKEQVPKTDTKKVDIYQKGHVFTREEIGKMSSKEYKKHEEEILDQNAKGLIK